jgi:O-antigen ligase
LEGRRIEGVIGGLFSNPNDLALHLVTMVPITLGLLLATRNILGKAVYLVCSLVFIAGIVVTFSRGGFLGFVVAIFVLAWKLARRSRLLFTVVGVCVIGGLIALAPGAFRGRISTTDDASAQARTDDLKRSIFLSIRHPLFGVGMGNYVFFSNRAKATHNAYTQVTAEMGLAAGVFYLLFLISPLRRLRRVEHETRELKGRKPPLYYLAVTIQASLLGFMVCSFFSSVAYLWYPYYLVAYAICVRRIYAATPEGIRAKEAALAASAAKPA